MIVMTALALFLMVVMMAFAVLVLMIVMTALALFLMVVMMAALIMLGVFVLFRLFGKAFELGSEAVALFHGGEQLFAVQLLPFGGDDGRLRMPAEERHRLVQLLVRQRRVREDDAACVLHLVEEEFAEVLQVHLALLGVDDGAEGVEFGMCEPRALHGADDVGELPHARRLDDDAVGRKLLLHLFQSLGKVAHERAADAARIHLGDLDARVFEEAAVHADLAELILDEHDLLARVGFLDEFLDERRLAGAQKPGNDVDFRHS